MQLKSTHCSKLRRKWLSGISSSNVKKVIFSCLLPSRLIIRFTLVFSLLYHGSDDKARFQSLSTAPFHDSLSLPEKGGRWLADPLIFIENFLYIGELALFAVYVCTRFVHWLRQISSRYIALWVQSRCVQIDHTYKIRSLRSESSSQNQVYERISPYAMYVRTEPVHTYIAKFPKRAIYTILYAPKVVMDILSTTT